jgi:hypothetical protein
LLSKRVPLLTNYVHSTPLGIPFQIEELAADYDSRMMLESYSMSISMSMAMEGDYRSRMMMESYSMSIYMLTSTSMSMSMAGEYGSRMLLESLSMSMDMSMSMFG